MEMGVRALDLPNATLPIPDYNTSNGVDPYQMIQLHDYQNVSFLRMDSVTKAASKKTIEIMASYYPELLSIKYFVNIPLVMSWVFTAMKAVLAKETMRKFRVLSSGKSLASDFSDEVPKAYGGKGPDLAEVGLTPKLIKDTPPPSQKEKKPSKKSSLASLNKMKEKFSDSVTTTVTDTKEGSTAPSPTVATIPEAKDEEAAAETTESRPTVPEKDKESVAPSEAPAVPAKEETTVASEAPAVATEAPIAPAKDEETVPSAEAAPEVPAKDESSTTVEAAASNAVVEEPTSSVAGGPTTEQASELAPSVEVAKSEKEERTNNESLTLGVVGVDHAVNEEKKLDESNATSQ